MIDEGRSADRDAAAVATPRGRTTLEPGTRVEVRNRFDGSWARGFEVADTLVTDASEVRYQLRRLSDSSILPEDFSRDELRRERRRQSFWWQ